MSPLPNRLRQRMMRRAVLVFSVRNRVKKARAIVEFMRRHCVENVVFVGAGGLLDDVNYKNTGIVEKAVSTSARALLALDLLPQRSPYPFVRADGCHLPLADDCTDMVLANAVIEHVGDREAQQQFVREQTRVARVWVITTPNRWFPVESHTSAVLRHWSPRWRSQQTKFTRLLSLREFKQLLPTGSTVVGRPWSATFTAFHAPAGHDDHDDARRTLRRRSLAETMDRERSSMTTAS